MRRVFFSLSSSAALVAAPCCFSLSRHWMSSLTFASHVQQLHNEYVREKSQETLAKGRRLFETEVIDDLVQLPNANIIGNNNGDDKKERNTSSSNTSMTYASAMAISNAATAFRIRPSLGSSFSAVVKWAMSDPKIVSEMPPEPLSRLLHACVILHSSLLFDLLTTYLWRTIELAPEMDPVPCAVIINAYGRAGVRHRKLYEALGKRAMSCVEDRSITLAHLANVLHSLSRVGYDNRELLDKIGRQCLKMRANASPLIVASILDSFATAGIVEKELFEAFEGDILTKNLEKCNAQLITSFINTLSKAGRTDSALFKACCKRSVAISGTFDSASIARVMSSLHTAGVNNEDLLGSLAERACKIPQDFRVVEARETLEALSNFELYDPELFPLLGTRVTSILRSHGVFDVDNVAAILAAFATVHERHEELIHVGSRILADSASCMAPRSYINALYSFAVHNVRNDPQRRIIENCRKQMPLLEAEAKKDPVSERRLNVANKAFFSSIQK